MSHRIDSHSEKSFPNVGVPVVLDFIICSSGQASSYGRPPITKQKVLKKQLSNDSFIKEDIILYNINERLTCFLIYYVAELLSPPLRKKIDLS